MQGDSPPVVDEKQPPPPAGPEPAAGATNWYDPLLKFFSSVHVAVVTLIILASISIIGTVLQQKNIGDVDDNLRLYQEFFGDAGRAQRAFDISERIGFFHLYQTWYFYALLGLLSTSLIVCSVRRLPTTWRIMARPKVDLEESGFKSSPNRRTLSLRLPRAEAAAIVVAALQKGGFGKRESQRDDALFLFGQKGAYSRLGIYATHFSIIMIFIGGLLGSIYGFKAYMQISEGETSDQIMMRGEGQRMATLPFQVRCDDFQVDYYPGGQRPKDYFSKLTVIDKGKETLHERIEVNSPLQYEGIWFYQSSYGDTGRGLKAGIRAVDVKTGAAHDLSFTGSEVQEVPGTGVRLRMQRIFPDFAQDEMGRPTSRSNQPKNPVAAMQVLLPDGRQAGLSLQAPARPQDGRGLPIV
jgi:cytochrome c biogenesis protein